MPQEVLGRLGGKPHPLRRTIIAPSEKRIRTLIHAIGAAALDDLTGGWLRALADGGRLEGLLRAIAIDGKWLRDEADGQVKLFAAMLHEEKVMIAQHPASPRSSAPCKPSDATGPACSATYRYEMHVTNNFADPRGQIPG